MVYVYEKNLPEAEKYGYKYPPVIKIDRQEDTYLKRLVENHRTGFGRVMISFIHAPIITCVTDFFVSLIGSIIRGCLKQAFKPILRQPL